MRMQESLIIVGWVAIWRPIEIFLYDWIRWFAVASCTVGLLRQR
ncbi:MAG: hypothetical protein WCB50_13625 [Pseudolabrys sp.]